MRLPFGFAAAAAGAVALSISSSSAAAASLPAGAAAERAVDGLLSIGALPALSNLFTVATVNTSSAGCTGRALAAGYYNVTLVTNSTSGGTRNRTHLVRIPPGYDGVQPMPTLFGLHGSQSDPMQLVTGGSSPSTGAHLDALADREQAILLLPTGSIRFYNQTAYNASNGTALVPMGFGWNVPYVPTISNNTYPDKPENDIAYLLQILAYTQQTLCVNKARSYATGHSGGGRMCSALACDPTASKSFAAVAPVSGLRAGPASAASNYTAPVTGGTQACAPARPVGIVTSHALNDTTNPYAGNTNPQWGYGVEAALAQWRALLGCPSSSAASSGGTNSTASASNSTAPSAPGVNAVTSIQTPVAGSLPGVTKRAWNWCGPSSRGGMTAWIVNNHNHPWPSDVSGWDVTQSIWDALQRYHL